jgi:hypothetical protein
MADPYWQARAAQPGRLTRRPLSKLRSESDLLVLPGAGFLPHDSDDSACSCGLAAA